MRVGPAFWSGLLVALVLDQGSKAVALRTLPYGTPLEVMGQFFRLTLLLNEGALFGLGRGWGWAFLVAALAFLMALPLLFGGRRSRTEQLALGLLAGGVIGNALDRLRLGGVVDFLDIGWGAVRWPVFNLADVAICLGVGLLVLRMRG